jgi:hypothetical protein
MNNVAESYTDLGRYEEALEMDIKTLEFRYRVLPEDHPDIGEGDAVHGGARCFPRVIFCVICRRGHA